MALNSAGPTTEETTMSRGKKGKEKQNGNGHKKGGGKPGSPGSRGQQAKQQARSGGNGAAKARRVAPVPSGVRRCRACGGNVTKQNLAKHERRDADGSVTHPCAPNHGLMKSYDLPPAPKPAAMQPPKQMEPPKPTKRVGRWVNYNRWACTTPGCDKTDCYDSEANCYGGCGCERPPMDQRPSANRPSASW